MTGIAEVASHENGFPTLFLDQRFDLLRIVIFVQIGNEKIGSFAGVGDGNSSTDSAVSTRNNGPQAMQSARAPIAAFAVVRSRLHFCCCARHWRAPTALHSAALYWHFVDVVWIFLFALIYLPGRVS